MSVFAGIVEIPGRRVQGERLRELAPPEEPGVTTTTWFGGSIGLLHAVEGVGSETPPAVQPTTDGATRAVVVFDGRLDARADLAAALGVGDTATVSDPELILASYARWGVATPERLVGDFAFAIWDPREQRLMLARDAIGARTLFYTECGGALRFASTLEQLLRVQDIPGDLDQEAVARYLYGDSRPTAANSYYRAIVQLRGGEVLVARSGKPAVTSRFWRWPDVPAAVRPVTPAAEEEFAQTFTTAVHDRLRSNAPVAVMLSGGLDSGAVASVAGALHRDSRAPLVRAYSIVFDTERFRSIDERRYSRSIVDLYGLPGSELQADGAWPLSWFEHWLPVFSEPLFAPYDGALHMALAAARRDGAGTMLMGHLGDLVVGGSARYFTDLLRPGSLGELQREVRAHAGRLGVSAMRALMGAVLFRLLPPRLQSSVEEGRSARLQGSWMPSELRTRFDISTRPVAFGGRNAWWSELRYLLGLMGQGRSGAYMDRMFRLFRLEQRQPFLDTRLLTLILTMPPQAFYSEGVQKLILRRSLANVLPPVVRDRPDKANFGPLAEYGLRGPHRTLVESLSRSSELAEAGLVHERPWQKGIRSFLDGEAPLSWGVWRSITLEMWLRHRAGRLRQLL